MGYNETEFFSEDILIQELTEFAKNPIAPILLIVAIVIVVSIVKIIVKKTKDKKK